MKKRILFISANPTTETWLALDEECRAIEARLRAARYRNIELVTRWAVRPNDLLQHFHEHNPVVVHFSGHGTKSGEIVLVSKNRTSMTVSVEALWNLFTSLKGNIRVVVLNACYSESQAKAICSVVDCCIGMNDSVLDDAAIVFAAAFYQAIGFGKSVKAAFDCGIAAIALDGIPGTGIPQLLCRKGVSPETVIVIGAQNNRSARGTAGLSVLRRKNRPLPRLMAKFQESDGNLCFATRGKLPEIEMDLWIEGAPPETPKVAFEILDEGVRDRKWTIRRKAALISVREFLTDKDFHLYGDVEIWARGTGSSGAGWVIQSTLHEALCRHYNARKQTISIQQALKQIRSN